MGGVAHHAPGQLLPVGLPPEHPHALFPGLPVEMFLADHHGQMGAGVGVDRLQYVLDLLAQFHIPDQGAVGKDRLYHPQGEGAQRAQLDAEGGLAGAFRFQGREALDAVAVFLRLVDPQEADAVGVEEVEMRQVAFPVHRLEQGPPVGQEACPVILAQGPRQRGVGGNEPGHHGEAEGLLVQGYTQIAGHLGGPVGDGIVQLVLMLAPEERPRPRHQDHHHHRQGRQQLRQDRLGRGVTAPGDGQGGHHADEDDQHQAHGQGDPGGHLPLPVAGIDVHAQHGEQVAAALVGPGGDNQIIHPLDIGGLGLDLLGGRILVLVIDPAAALGQGDVPHLPAEVFAAGPVLFVDEVLTHQFRFHRMGLHGHVQVVGEDVEAFPAKFPMRVVDFLEETLAAMLAVEVHRLAHHRLSVVGRDQAGEGRRRIIDGDQTRDPGAPTVGGRTLDRLDPVLEDAETNRRNLVIDLAGRGIALRIGRLAVHVEKHRAIGLATHEIDKPALRAGRADGGELFLESLIFRAVQVRLAAGERLDLLDIYSLHRHPHPLQQVGAHLAVGLHHRPPGEQGSESKHGQQQRHRQMMPVHTQKTAGLLIVHVQGSVLVLRVDMPA